MLPISIILGIVADDFNDISLGCAEIEQY
uniref:Uncharacterized protein n=1 Tax=Rhizophora mucronata TaxID=61149 RepID=A0A2P2NAH9_RHIMU